MNIRFSDKIQEFVTFLTALCSNLQKSIANEEICNMHTLPQVQVNIFHSQRSAKLVLQFVVFFVVVAKHEKTW